MSLQQQPERTARFEWGFSLVSIWLVTGVSIDGWAHNHLAQLETFFTPWHAILYSGYLAVALYLIIAMFLYHRQGYAWFSSLPQGYKLSLSGALIFFVGGVGDLTWHTINGIEKNIEALLSPTHLALALGVVLMVAAPVRAARANPLSNRHESWRTFFPVCLSLSLVLAILLFFTQFANPIIHSVADKSSDPTVVELGLASIILSSLLITGTVLFIARWWHAPLGTFALVFAIDYTLCTVLADNSIKVILISIILSAMLGFIVDLFYLWLKPSVMRKTAFYLFGFLVPLCMQIFYFVVTAILSGVVWSANLWAGSIVMASLGGLLVSYLLVGKAQDLRAEEVVTNEETSTSFSSATSQRSPSLYGVAGQEE